MTENSFYDKNIAKLRNSVYDKQNSAEFVNEFFFNKIRPYITNAKILDIGTGNGYLLSQLSTKNTEIYHSLYGIDNSMEMIINASKVMHSNSNLLVADNFKIPFKSNSIEIIMAKNVTNFSSEEVFRILKPKGHFFFREYGPGKGLIEVAKLFLKRLIRSRNPDFYINSLDKAGFTNIELDEFKINREYSKEQLLNIISMYPFIVNFSEEDKTKVTNLASNGIIEITSDLIIITAQK